MGDGGDGVGGGEERSSSRRRRREEDVCQYHLDMIPANYCFMTNLVYQLPHPQAHSKYHIVKLGMGLGMSLVYQESLMLVCPR